MELSFDIDVQLDKMDSGLLHDIGDDEIREALLALRDCQATIERMKITDTDNLDKLGQALIALRQRAESAEAKVQDEKDFAAEVQRANSALAEKLVVAEQRLADCQRELAELAEIESETQCITECSKFATDETYRQQASKALTILEKHL